MVFAVVAVVQRTIPANVLTTARACGRGRGGGFLAVMVACCAVSAQLVRRHHSLRFVQILSERRITTVGAMASADNMRAMGAVLFLGMGYVGRVSRVRSARDDGM